MTNQSITDSVQILKNMRNRLLDTTRTNKLINFGNIIQDQEKLKNRSILINQSDQDALFKGLVNQCDVFICSESNNEALLSLDLMPSEQKICIYASDTQENLNQQLKKIEKKYNLFLEESGVNILHFVFGILEWYENENSEVPIFSPVLLISVNINKNHAISLNCEEALELNKNLQQRLMRDFNFSISDIDTKSSDISNFLKELENTITPWPRWKIHYQTWLALIDDSQRLIYEDINPDVFSENPLIKKILTGVEEENDQIKIKKIYENKTGRSLEYDIDLYLEDNTKSAYDELIFDADSSQHSAIIDALNGNSLVIEGPPGTGKSQTISNLIAAAMADGKSVLFVSEKEAALNVVYSKLHSAGLSDFCLELYSHNTSTTSITKAYQNRKSLVFDDPNTLDDQIKLRLEKKKYLGQYVNLINQVDLNKLNKTIHQILWAKEHSRLDLDGYSLPHSILAANNIDATKLDLVEMNRHLQILDLFCNYQRELTRNTWRGFYPNSDTLLGENRDQILSELNHLIKLVSSYRELLNEDFLAEFFLSVKENNYKHIVSKIENLYTLTDLVNKDSQFHIDWEKRERLLELKLLTDKINADNKKISSALRFDFTNQENIFYAKSKISKLSTITYYEKISLLNQEALEAGLNSCKHFYSSYEGLLTIINFFSKLLKINTESVHGVKLTIAIVRLLTIFPNESLEKCRKEWFCESGQLALSKLEEKYLLVNKKQKKVEEYFWFDSLPNIEDIKFALSKIRESGILSSLDKKWKSAKSIYESMLCKKEKFDQQTCINRLASLISFLEERKEFLSDLEALKINDINEFLKAAAAGKWQKLFVEQIYKLMEIGENASCENIINIDNNFLFQIKNKKDHISRLGLSFEISHSELVENLNQFGFSNSTDISIFEQVKVAKQLSADIEAVICVLSKISSESLITTINLISSAEHLLSAKTEVTSFGKDLLGELYTSIDTDLSYFDHAIEWCEHIHSLSFSKNIESWIYKDKYNNICHIKKIAIALENFWKQKEVFINMLNNFGSVNLEELMENKEPDIYQINLKAIEMLKNSEQLSDAFNKQRNILNIKNKGLYFIVELHENHGLPINKIETVYKYCIYYTIASQLEKKYPEISMFSTIDHEHARVIFQQLDREITILNRKRIAYKISNKKIPQGQGSGRINELTDIKLLDYQSTKSRGMLSVRDLIAKSEKALLGLMPCFMMSPLAVVKFLQQNICFDMLIIDEASQLRPEKAFSLIVRAKQIIIVGDSKQLPPTNFFNNLDQADLDINTSIAEDAESILELCQATLRPNYQLRWHYRSRHQSLIAFSNKYFYDSELILFPSPYIERAELGLKQHFVKNAVYENRVNQKEAEDLVDAVFAHFIKYPDQSVGVITLNDAQGALIDGLFNKRLDSIIGAQEYIDRWIEKGEKFFIKNIETVQGDERDVIFISTTFGKNKDGKFSINFGPINQQGGFRRLNVLFTRARNCIHLFTSIEVSIMQTRITEKVSRGVKSFYDYLVYAANGGILQNQVTKTGREPDSDFERSVIKILQKYGFSVEPQLGVAGYRIDIAVYHPHNSSEYIAAIECDGATYHSARSARDRDRLRQEVLENLGWKDKIYRIWSTDWFKNPKSQTDKLITWLSSKYTANDT